MSRQVYDLMVRRELAGDDADETQMADVSIVDHFEYLPDEIAAFARLDRNLLTIGTDEKAFGAITLDLGDKAQVWASSLRRLGN